MFSHNSIRIGLHDVSGHIQTDLDMRNPNLKTKSTNSLTQRRKLRKAELIKVIAFWIFDIYDQNLAI